MRLYFVVNFKSALESRGNLLFQIIGMALNNAAFLVFWNILLQPRNPFISVLASRSVLSASSRYRHIL